MNPNFTDKYLASINSSSLAQRLIESLHVYGSADEFIAKMQTHFQTTYNSMYGLSIIANSVVEVSSNFGNNTQNGPFLHSSTVALSGIEVFIGLSSEQKVAISKLQMQNLIKPDFEDQSEVDEFAKNIMDMGYDGYYGLSPSMREFYHTYEDFHFTEDTPNSYIEKSRAGFGFPYSIIEKVIKADDLEDFKMQIATDIDWDAELTNLSTENNEK